MENFKKQFMIMLFESAYYPLSNTIKEMMITNLTVDGVKLKLDSMSEQQAITKIEGEKSWGNLQAFKTSLRNVTTA